MNKQDIYNKVVTHLFKQGQRAINTNQSCRYRTENGLMCAVGCLIPEDMYSSAMEGQTFFWLLESSENSGYSLPDYIVDQKNYAMLNRLQGVHDDQRNWTSAKTMRDALAKVAVVCRLDSSILEGLDFEQTST